MAKLAYGVPDKHILKSYGADSDPMKFYCTQNATTYGVKWAKFEPRVGRPVGSGYTSNVRPTIAYCARLDDIDNPAMGLDDSFHLPHLFCYRLFPISALEKNFSVYLLISDETAQTRFAKTWP